MDAQPLMADLFRTLSSISGWVWCNHDSGHYRRESCRPCWTVKKLERRRRARRRLKSVDRRERTTDSPGSAT